MFDIFKQKEVVKESQVASVPTLEVVVDITPVVEKNSNKLVEEIHHTFYTEIERLLVDANIQTPIEESKAAEKTKLLKSLGFCNSKDVDPGQKIIQEQAEITRANANKKLLLEAERYFSVKYPSYKLITPAAVKRICNQYGLVLAKVEKYIGSVPDKNLEQIANFKVRDENKVYYFDYGDNEINTYNLLTYAESQNYKQGYNRVKCASFEIVASIKDFDTKGMKLDEHKLKLDVPDPVVLHPVQYNKNIFYFIVTAWGPEASDPEVVNPKDN